MISWTRYSDRSPTTLNVTAGCTRVSDGCRNCYAEALHSKFHAGHPWANAPEQYAKPFSDLQVLPERLKVPATWKKPRFCFLGSASDLLHEGVPDDYLDRIWTMVQNSGRHLFVILTKRSERLHLVPKLPNLWVGVSAEDGVSLERRLRDLQGARVTKRVLSLEPLLGPVDALSRGVLRGIGWVIVGGETGRHPRPLNVEWIKDVVQACRIRGVPVFVKQDRGTKPEQQGRINDEWFVREWPRGGAV